MNPPWFLNLESDKALDLDLGQHDLQPLERVEILFGQLMRTVRDGALGLIYGIGLYQGARRRNSQRVDSDQLKKQE